MATIKTVTPGKRYMGKLPFGGDLLEEITEICVKENISLGRVEAIGAVQKARLAFYNQETKEYNIYNLNKTFEITKLIGNISIKDGAPMVHAHITLADGKGNCFGGHLAPGTIVFACEIILESFDGPLFERGHDEETGLPLWEIE
jgi:uncharacterized protein